MGTCTPRLCHTHHGQAMKKTMLFKVLLAAGGLLCTAVPWGDPVPSGAMAEYLVHCDGWSLTNSTASCAGFLDRLAAEEHPSPDERLALLLTRRGISHEEGCAGLETIAGDHPDYAEVLYYLGLYGCVSEAENVALMRRALEIEPDNYRVLSWLLLSVEGLPPEAPDFPGTASDIDSGSLAAYREALYEAGLARAVWWQEVMKDAEPDDPPAEELVQRTIWDGPLTAGRSIYAAAVREGDHRAAEAIQTRLRRDLGLDALDYGAENGRASLALACHPALHGPLGMDDVCLSGIEKLAGQASEREAFAQHWLRTFWEADTAAVAHAAWRLFLASVDRRTWVWMSDVQDGPAQDEPELQATKRRFVGARMRGLRRAMANNEKEWADNFAHRRYPKAPRPWNG